MHNDSDELPDDSAVFLSSPRERFTAIRDARMIVTSTAEAKAKYPPGSLKLDPKWRRPACTEEAYRAAMLEGMQAARDGKPQEACPYDAAQDVRADAWNYGWRPSLPSVADPTDLT